MDYSIYIVKTLLILCSLVLSISVCQRLGLGIVFGFLSAGILIGPSVLGLVTDYDLIHFLGEFGIVFLLFMIGLEIKPSRLWLMRRHVFGLGGMQVLISGTIISMIVGYLGMSIEASILIGFSLALSSTAIGLQILSERGELGTHYGKNSFSILLFQDLMSVPLLAMIPMFAAGDSAVSMEIFYGLSKAGGILAGVIVVGKYFVSPMLHAVAKSKSTEAFTAITIALVLFMAYMVSLINLPMALGAFLAGMMMAESEYRHQVQASITPFKAVLMGLFFMTIGMEINFVILRFNFEKIMAIVAFLMLMKVAVIFYLSRKFDISKKNSFKSAILLASSGEFALIVLKMASYGPKAVIPYDTAYLLTLCVAVSMFLTPFIVKFAMWVENNNGLFDDGEDLMDYDFEPISNHVIITGFGRVGRTIAKMLEESGVTYTALDSDPDVVARARKAGHPVFYGDTTSPEVLKIVGADRAKCAVVALDNTAVVKKCVIALSENFPHINIYARARNHMESHLLANHGATEAVPETIESSLQLGRAVLGNLGIGETHIRGVLNTLRDNHYEKLHHIVGFDEKLANLSFVKVLKDNIIDKKKRVFKKTNAGDEKAGLKQLKEDVKASPLKARKSNKGVLEGKKKEVERTKKDLIIPVVQPKKKKQYAKIILDKPVEPKKKKEDK